MKTLFTLLMLIASIQISAQSEIYTQKMSAALASYSQCKSTEDYINSSFQFQQIASVETENWLPRYYHIMCYTMASYTVPADNSQQKDAYLDIAEENLTKLKELAPKESEVFALEALFYTARLSVNPMERGQKYSLLSQKSVGKSLALNPDNLRAKQLQIANEFGTAQFFGADTAPICKKAQALLSTWDNYPPETAFHPNWGKGYLTSIAKSCEKKPDSEISTTNDSMNDSLLRLKVSITHLVSDEGIVLIQIKNDQGKVIQSDRGLITSGKSEIIFKNLSPGDYSISYFHDANTNMKMDTDKYGRPLEGYGYSNNAKGIMKAPEFSKTIFTLDKELSLTLKTRN